MRFKIRMAICSLLLAATASSPVFSQNLSDTVTLNKRLSLLNKKVFFNFPATAVITPRQADVMAADPNENRETRIFVEFGNMKLAFFAQELFALGGKNIFNDIVKQDPANAEYKRRLLTDRDSIVTILTTPAVFDSTAGGILINSLLVKTQDNTVLKLDAYINPDAWPLKEEFTKLTENIFKTVSKGSRAINLGARDERYKLLVGDDKLVFKLPKNYFVTVDEKFDFIVYKINHYKDITDTSYTSITLYTGGHPSYFYKEYDLDEKTATKIKGQFLQAPIDWLFFKDGQTGLFLKEQIIPIDSIEKGMVIHVAMLSNNKEMLGELTKLVEEIRVEK